MLVQVEGHGVIFSKIFDFPALVYQFAFLVLQLFFGDDPVIVDFFSFLLEVGEQFLLLFNALFEISEFLAHGKLSLCG